MKRHEMPYSVPISFPGKNKTGEPSLARLREFLTMSYGLAKPGPVGLNGSQFLIAGWI